MGPGANRGPNRRAPRALGTVAPGQTSGGGSAMGGSTSGPSHNVEELERTGRRMTLLNNFVPDLVTSTPEGALALAETTVDDNELLRSGLEATNYASLQTLAEELQEEDAEVSRAIWAGLPTPIAEALQEMGVNEPKPPESKGRLFGSVPIIGDITEMALDWGEIPGVGGALEEAQNFLGEGAEGVADITDKAMTPFRWMGDQVTHAYRAQTYARNELGQGSLLSPSALARAWDHTERDDGYVQAGSRARARDVLGGDGRLYRLAKSHAMGRTPDEVIRDAGYEPDSPEGIQLGIELTTVLQADPNFGEAVDILSTGMVSPGRDTARAMGFTDTDRGWGRIVSGTVDGGFQIVYDPTLAAGAATKAWRFGRHAFRLETMGDVNRMRRVTNLAADGIRAERGIAPAHVIGDVRPQELRRAGAVTNWANRVSEGFQTVDSGGLSRLSREAPTTATAMDSMVTAHTRRVALGQRGLDDPLGVVEWLEDRDGILTMAATRLGGASPMTHGLRLPTLTATQRAGLRAKGLWTQGVDWARGIEAPEVKTMIEALGRPKELVSQLGRFGLAHTVGDTGRVLASLTAHVPYSAALPLYGNQSVEEFTRLVNTGIFTNMPRHMMDDYVSSFAAGDFVTRSNMVEQFLQELFSRTGVAKTEAGARWAERFVGRHRQAYAIDSEDVIDNAGIQSHSARLVDAQHADALAIPVVRDFLGASKRDNLTRFLTHNTPLSWTDAQLGRFWKPAVLMRIGFIPRAAGEEVLHYALKHGPRQWLGAKGAQWQLGDEIAHDLEARMAEAEALGRTDELNRLEQQYTRVAGSSLAAPLRSLAAGGDRMWTRLWATDKTEPGAWSRRWTEKAHAIDERGVVSGLEHAANEISLRTSGVIERLAIKAHMPSKAEIGAVMAERWSPGTVDAARLLLTDPRFARAYAEQISGQTMTPWESRRSVDPRTGGPRRTIEVQEISGGRPVVREVPMVARSGEYETFRVNGGDTNAYFNSIFSRHHRLRRDRVANSVIRNVLPRHVGPWGGTLTNRLGYGDDIAGLRGDLNQLWAYKPEAPPPAAAADDVLAPDPQTAPTPTPEAWDGASMHRAAQRLLDKDPDIEDFQAYGTVLARQITATAKAKGLRIDGNKLVKGLLDDKLDNPAQHWLLYNEVDPGRLLTDWRSLEGAVRNASRGRLSRPDMIPKLRESRLYAADEHLALPTANGISKIYTPMVTQPVQNLGDDFVASAARRIRMIGGYSQTQAEAIARNVQAGAERAGEVAAHRSDAVPLSAWGTSDPRVADAVMGAADEVTGQRSRFGILEVPDDHLQVAAGDRALGIRTRADNWQVADDYEIDPWRLIHTQLTDQQRRMSQLDIGGEWWDDAELDNATTHYLNQRAGTTRMWSTDHQEWSPSAPPDEPFWFVDMPTGILGPNGNDLTVGGRIPDEIVQSVGRHRVPGTGDGTGTWRVREREVGQGLGEIEALERVANASSDEIYELLTTLKRADLDDDVLHEVVEPLLRPRRTWVDDAGNEQVTEGYGFDHLVLGTHVDRLPKETYGPKVVPARDLRFDKIAKEWFEGPVDQALSSVIRSNMFINNFAEQLNSSKAIADMFVDDDIWAGARASGLDDDALDGLAVALWNGTPDNAVMSASHEQVQDAFRVQTNSKIKLSENDAQVLRRFSQQRMHGLNLVRQNAMNRSMQLTIPFIDDHRIRSAFQQYVGNLVPFQFAEEQFLKRWARSIWESPEMIRKAQLGMSGMRSMGVIRQDDQGNEIFVFPLVGEAVSALSAPAAAMFGENLRIPYVGTMTGRVDYTLPGLGDQFGTPSVGPLIAMPLEVLSRHFPELAEFEQKISGPGADRPIWNYFVPTWAGRTWESAFGEIDKGQLASATLQAMSMMAVNGQAPPENATEDEMQQFIDRARGQARTIIMARGLLGMVSPTSPQWQTKADELNAEYVELLRNTDDAETATTAFLARYPDAEPADLLAATVFTSETTYAGLPTPTEETFAWIEGNEALVDAFPAAAPWLLPRPEGTDDKFSYRAWAQQLAKGLRERKTPETFLEDVYFAGAARDYFEAKTLYDAERLTADTEGRAELTRNWEAYKAAYYRQHPVFARALQDPTRTQRRQQAISELSTLAQDETVDMDDDLRSLVELYEDYQMNTAGLRGQRFKEATDRRKFLTQQFAAEAEWIVQRSPHLAGFWTRIIEPELTNLDEDGVTTRRGA
jgi:hypothetical protein